MTENEAIKKIKYMPVKLFDEEADKAKRMAIKALEEIQQYRAIGTVEDIQEVMALCKSLQETTCKYMDIGTIEEFKALKDINRVADNLSKMERIEFKALKEKEERFDRNIRMFNEIGLEIRANAIDEFVERLKVESFSGYVTLEDYCEDTVECVSVEDIDNIAEQLKAGEK